jgi:hypothetical protein
LTAVITHAEVKPQALVQVRCEAPALEEGLSLLGRSCEEFEIDRLSSASWI